MEALSGHPCVLMVSGGSDSIALLEMAARLDCRDDCKVLHIHHGLRASEADADAAFVQARCEDLGLACEVRHVDVEELHRRTRRSIEDCARELRYAAGEEVLDVWCEQRNADPEQGLLVLAHTLDDRIETFFMRSLTGAGPSGLASIPRRRGRIYRPLLSRRREELRDYLRDLYPDHTDAELWREDATNEDGSNFRSRVRTQLIPVLRDLRPGFETSLERTMDLVEDEQTLLADDARSLVLRNLVFDAPASAPDEQEAVQAAHLPLEVLEGLDRPMCRRVVLRCLLEVRPTGRFEAVQVERIVDGIVEGELCTEVSGGIRVQIEGGELRFSPTSNTPD
ncbi:MAG: tRNA lysidine(34) synthetase TilS [Coriobacteriaceae bacterium]|nr:tRNA lysidine(34) synthetase TilS [Coriobacteriaceae bacterium]